MGVFGPFVVALVGFLLLLLFAAGVALVAGFVELGVADTAVFAHCCGLGGGGL